jgi:hypothetical protein
MCAETATPPVLPVQDCPDSSASLVSPRISTIITSASKVVPQEPSQPTRVAPVAMKVVLLAREVWRLNARVVGWGNYC